MYVGVVSAISSDFFWVLLPPDYDEKAEDAVDYEDIEEQYEGPEIQAASEEDNLLPEKDYLSAEVPFATLYDRTSVYDDENYDEDEENEKEQELVDKDATQTTLSGLLCATLHPEFLIKMLVLTVIHLGEIIKIYSTCIGLCHPFLLCESSFSSMV